MIPPSVNRLRALIDAAERAGVHHLVLSRAAAELMELVDRLAIEPDPRKVMTYERARDVHELDLQGLPRRVIRERTGLSIDQINRARRAWRDSRHTAPVQRSQESIKEE
jgi:hypothetical protein